MRLNCRYVQYLFALLFVAVLMMPAEGAVNIQCPCPPGTPVQPPPPVGSGNIECTIGLRNIACKHLTAGDGFVKMADGSDIYIFGFSDVTGLQADQVMNAGMLAANFSAPTIIVREGQELYLTLTNVGMVMRPDLFDPHTVHYHGFPNASSVFDGEPMASISVNMGASLTYYYNIVEPGTYMYHCHVEATEHMQMGMLGNLFVTPAQDGTTINGFSKFAYNDTDGSTGYDVAYPVQIVAFDPIFHEADLIIQPLPFASMFDSYGMLNGRGYPDTINTSVIFNKDGMPSQQMNALITATKGQKILLRVSSLSTVDFNTLISPSIPMKVVGRGARIARGPDPDGAGPLQGKNLYYTTNSLTLGGGESFDVILDTSAVPAGTYFLYSSNLHNLSNDSEDFGGMMTEIVVNP